MDPHFGQNIPFWGIKRVQKRGQKGVKKGFQKGPERSRNDQKGVQKWTTYLIEIMHFGDA